MADQDNGGREQAASGWLSPTTEEARHELKIIQDLLEDHGCPTTRDLVAQAAVAVDIAHRDAHSPTPAEAQSRIVTLIDEDMKPFVKKIDEKAKGLPEFGPEAEAKFYARLTSIFLNFARVYGYKAIQVAQLAAAEGVIPAVAPTATVPPETGQRIALVGSESDKDISEAIKKLLDKPIKSKYKN